MSEVFITGGTGDIGSRLIPLLVYVRVAHPAPAIRSWVRWRILPSVSGSSMSTGFAAPFRYRSVYVNVSMTYLGSTWVCVSSTYESVIVRLTLLFWLRRSFAVSLNSPR